MKGLLFVTLIFFSATTQGQDELPLEYFDKDWKESSREGAVYYRKTIYDQAMYRVSTHRYDNDKMLMNGVYSQLSPSRKQHGIFFYYYENGQLKETGSYEYGNQKGMWKTYYENGKSKGETIHDDGQIFYVQRWDINGAPILVNGTGMFSQDDGDRIVQMETYDSMLTASFSVHGGDTVFLVLQNPAEFPGGYESFYRKILQLIKYPKAARKAGIEGKVYVEFIVDKTGVVRDVNVLKGLMDELDRESVRVIREINFIWKPGHYKEKPVHQKLVLPINFKLGDQMD